MSQEAEYANEINELIMNNLIEMTSHHLININKVPQVLTGIKMELGVNPPKKGASYPYFRGSIWLRR